MAGSVRGKLKLDISDPKTRAIWEACLRAKKEVASWPAWKRGEDTEDFTVYDLAQRIAAGQQMSEAAEREVSAELTRMIQWLHARCADATAAKDRTPREEASALRRLRSDLAIELQRILDT